MVRPEKQRGSLAASTPSAPRPTKKPSQTQRARPSSCLVCKFRRVKCDGVRPGCGQCRQVKRQCHGYPDDLRRGSTPAESVASSSSASSSSTLRAPAVKVIGSGEQDDRLSASKSLALRTPPGTPEPDERRASPPVATEIQSARSLSTPSIIFPSTSNVASAKFSGVSGPPSIATFFNKPERNTPEDTLVHMYRCRTMPALHLSNSGGVTGEWRTYIIQAIDEDKTLRYVAAALASYHDHYLTSSQSSSALASKYYSKGLTSLTNSFGHASLDPDALFRLMMSASVLLGVEYFRRNFSAIRVHFQSIIKVLGDRSSSQMTPPLFLAERFLRRSYIYFNFFPALYPNFDALTREEVRHRSWLPPSLPTTFHTVFEAETVLHDLLWPWMFFYQSLARVPHLAQLPQAHLERKHLLSAFDTWTLAFESYCGKHYDHLPLDRQVFADIFRLWSTTVRLCLTQSLVAEELPYDAFTPVFKAMVARTIAIQRRTTRDTRISFEPMLSYMAPTFFIIAHCRDPRVRRDALAIVYGTNVTHGPWHPPATARVGMRLVEIEEWGWRARDDVGEEAGERRVVKEAADVREEDRCRDVRFHVDMVRGVVEIGAVVWNGEDEGWAERREELSLPGL